MSPHGATGKRDFYSQDAIPANAYVEVLDVEVEGDFSRCKRVMGAE